METQSKKIAVLILNWNGRELLERFLPSIVENNSSNADVIVIDNASTDNSVAFIKEAYPHIQCIEFKENYGFALGYNLSDNFAVEAGQLLGSVVSIPGAMIGAMIEVIYQPAAKYVKNKHAKVVAEEFEKVRTTYRSQTISQLAKK